MLDDLFNRYLERNPHYNKMKKKIKLLEDELKQYRKTDNLEPRLEPKHLSSQTPYMIPPHITINVNRRDEGSSYKLPTGEQPKEPKTPFQQARRIRSIKPKQQKNLPPERNSDSPTYPTYIEFLNVEKIVIDRYEQSNNFGALGIKSLEGRLNIGANYGDKNELPEEVKKKFAEKMEAAESWKSFKTNKDEQENSQETWESIIEWDKTGDWDDFFHRQPINAVNNQEDKGDQSKD